ncbi:MAG: hypothetical protein HYX35_05785 [Proteobacteria bacterium]|nr:hypothetical protein [Pseudomonadota bacterium]
MKSKKSKSKKIVLGLLAAASLLAATPVKAMQDDADESSHTLPPPPPPPPSDTTPKKNWKQQQAELKGTSSQPQSSQQTVVPKVTPKVQQSGGLDLSAITSGKGSLRKTGGIPPKSISQPPPVNSNPFGTTVGKKPPVFQDVKSPSSASKHGSLPKLPVLQDKPLSTVGNKMITKPPLLEDWVKLGLLKTKPIEVVPGQKLTVTAKFAAATEKTVISFLNSGQNGYYPGEAIVNIGDTEATFSSVVPAHEAQTWLVTRNSAFDGKTPLTLGVKFKSLSIQPEEGTTPESLAKTLPILKDWEKLGLVKTNPIEVKPGQKLTVTCTFDGPVTENTALGFLNSAQNGYYAGEVIVTPGETTVTFSSVVPASETQTWLIVRNPAFNGVSELSLGAKLKSVSLKTE